MSRLDAVKQLFEGTLALVGGIAVIALGAIAGTLLIRWILLHA